MRLVGMSLRGVDISDNSFSLNLLDSPRERETIKTGDYNLYLLEFDFLITRWQI
jgi:hypothetical protein